MRTGMKKFFGTIVLMAITAVTTALIVPMAGEKETKGETVQIEKAQVEPVTYEDLKLSEEETALEKELYHVRKNAGLGELQKSSEGEELLECFAYDGISALPNNVMYGETYDDINGWVNSDSLLSEKYTTYSIKKSGDGYLILMQ